ncbi:MAG TPA: LytS/YhcK type 5TM receptor domain-containing protein [Methanospirillum sp.]|uniref:LytS/YhcK type 5TM receptor domain-containing protein n=1 Tax=Methanospirillum sp. TaxID=45200 RepID=UPI002C2EF159|nr:LytS/YhcK type 5TM receptor domain-containing protein [Methanospirillum sp.]HWQ63837.1 LytS/YhcK type 5TM receptor domain-containing protein [Methanospirillum sp.]
MTTKFHSLTQFSLPTLTDLIFFLGPCIMLAVSISGRGFPEAVNAGTLTGFSFLWLAILVLIYKYVLVEGLARYTLAKGEHIFDGMHGFPGPENWEVFFMVLIYVLEMIGYGGLALFSAQFLQELIPISCSREILATITLFIILPLLIKKNFTLFEKLVLFFAAVMIGGVIYTFLGITIPFEAMAAGLIPSASRGQVTEIIPIMGAVGSGLNLLIFSIWLREKIGLRHGASFYAEQIRNVRITQGIAFLITGLMTLAFFTMGYYTKGAQDLFAGAVAGLNTLPYGAVIFFFTGYVILFGVLITGADGRARAVASILCSTGVSGWNEKRTYQIIITGFIGLMLFIVWSGNPKTLLSYTSAFGAFMFAFTGIMMLYLDAHLPRYARGSRLWFVIMTAGTFAYLLMALFREEVFYDVGLPLVQNLLGLLILLYLVIRSGVITPVLDHKPGRGDLLLFICIFSILGIYGTRSSILIDTLPISFGTLIPIIAAFLGGPIAGIIVGAVSGIGGYGSPGFETLPWYAEVIPPLAAGCLAGLVSRYRDAFASRRTLILGLITGFTGLIQVILVWAVKPAVTGDAIDELHQITIPTLGTLVIGLVIVLYLIEEEKKTRRTKTHPEPVAHPFPVGIRQSLSQAWESGMLLKQGAVILIIGFALIGVLFSSQISETGVPLLNRIAVLGAIIFLLTRSRTFQDILISATTITERIWLTVIFGLFSAYGYMEFISPWGITIQFPDLGPAIAGILGGPFIGAAAGVLGGGYALVTGGPDMAASALITIISGVLAGLFALLWRRNLTYQRVIFIGLLIGSLRFLLLFVTGEITNELVPGTFLLNVLFPVSGLILFQFIIREETISFLSISRTGNAAEDRIQEKKLAILSSETMERLSGLFTIISGRLLSLEFIMSQIGEEEIARKVRTLISTDLIDDLLEDFSQFSNLHKEGTRDDLELALKAGQITRKLDRIIKREGLDRIIHPSLIRRADRLYQDYLALLEGEEPVPREDHVELSGFIRSILDDLTNQQVTDEEFLEASDDPELYIRLLVTRLAHIPIFETVSISFDQNENIPVVCIARDRFEDFLISLLENLGVAGAESIRLSCQKQETDLLLTLDCLGSGPGWPPAQESLVSFFEECRISGGKISQTHSESNLLIHISLTPWQG